MTVCRFYLQGTCRFGNKCRFEHIDPEYNEESYDYNNRRGSSYGYQDRYQQQTNYQNRQNNYEDHNLSYGPRRYGGNERQYQNYGSQKYQGQYTQNYERDNQREIYYSSPKHSYNSRYDVPSSESNPSYSNYYQNKYGRKQYEWVSEDYKKRQQHESTNYEDTPINKKYTPSQVSFSFKDNNYEDDKESVDEKTLNLADRIKEDITAWELGNQWPFTCYHPLTEREGYPGFNDISFEELRYETLKAKENNSFDLFAEMVKKSILDINHRRDQLKQPSDQMFLIIDKLRRGDKLSDESSAKGLSFMHSTQATVESIDTDESSNLTVNKASSFSFKLPDNDKLPSSIFSSTVNKASTFSFRDTLDKDTSVKNTASSFSFKLPESDKLPSSTLSSTESSLYTPIEELSKTDKEQFMASTFTLGKIPTVPPPKVLCF